ncbi:MAG TPA: tetratricopeptide repeat protein, partial [Gemmataceae bacterium]|nr:tetratricopeptide repeat protein [Gemmataceae bacterium]
VTWDSAVAVIDQGIPFTLTTPEVSSSHLQAVIGYDSIRGTLIIRDPGERHQSEFLAEGLSERYASTGPRGMALVPMKEKKKLASLNLPDSDLYDLMYQVEKALEAHDRAKAEKTCRELEAKAGKHRLAYLAWRTLAVYDSDTPRILAVTEKQLELFPDDLRWQLSKVNCLRSMARRDETLALLKKLSEQKISDPACWQQYAQELADDAREHPRALHLLRRSLRCNPGDARTFHCLARIYWDKRQFAEAFDLYRIAACLEETDEHLARSYFQAATSLGKTEEAIEFLQQRFERFGHKSGQPARTLSWAYFQLERTREGFDVLEKALRQRPDDADLLLYAVDQRIQYGSFVEARRLLIEARGRSQKTAWLRSAANLAASQGDLVVARKVWAKVLEVEPLADDAHAAYARLLAETKGRAAALKHLHKTCDRFPYNFQLKELLVQWLQEDGPDAVEPVVRKLIDIHPANAWARRELALVLADKHEMGKAFAELEEAGRLEPDCISYHTVRGRLMSLAGRMDEAKECYRDALRISVDLEHAMHEWIDACETEEERREALGFIEEELVRQVISGTGLLTFRDVARQTMEPDELLVSLRNFQETRPDLWQSWSAVIRQLRDMEQHEEALETAQLGLERFPLLPELWVDLSEVYQAMMNGPAAIKALEKALKINFGWAYPLRLLADLYQREGQVDQAKALIQRAIDRAPLMSANHFTMAMVLWNNGERDKGLEKIKQTVLLDPSYDTAWDYLCDWSAERNQFQGVVDLARSMTEKRPGETRSWMRLAQALLRMPSSPDVDQDERIEECLDALKRVHHLNPRLIDAYDLEAQVLAEAGRFDEATEACQAPVWNGKPPVTLRGRRAWLMAQNGDVEGAIESMRAIVKDDPAYFWGWTKLAEWYEGTGKQQNYLSAAQQMVRLAPQSPIAWAYRGEAKLLLGDRKSGKKDLRMACHIAPDYSFAGLKLFDEELADAQAAPEGAGTKELARARRTLMTLYQHVRDDLVKTRLVQWFALRRKEKQAIKAFVQVCRSPNGGPWPVETSARAMSEAGWHGRVDSIFQKVLQEERWNPFVAIQWADRYDPDMDNELEGRLEALDRAIPMLQDPLRPVDLKAELLTKAGRFDEALEVCEDPPPGTEIPIRGRAAWIEYQRGNKEKAIKRMNAVVADDSQYYWGFSQLADWNEELEHHEEHLEAAEKLVELAPDNPVSYVHRAQAKRALEDKKGAKEDYQHAVDMAPDYVFPAFRLFQMHLEAGNTKAAERILNGVREHCSPGDFA